MADSSPLMHRKPEHLQLIEFVRSAQSEQCVGKHHRTRSTQSFISGDDAKSFYEELCQECITRVKVINSLRGERTEKSQSKNSWNKSIHFKTLNKRVRDHKTSELFKFSQNGDNLGVKRLLQEGVEVNDVDYFGWTATMSAAFAGHIDVLVTLLEAGADLSTSNSQGHTALSLAQLNHHENVVKFLESYQYQKVGLIAASPKDVEKQVNKVYCEICKLEFTDTDQQTHVRSVVHIFNMGHKPKDDPFFIPPSNRGYRLMLKTGWDGNRGLGPDGCGQRFPVKTVLKRDREGLGRAVAGKAKVTHFQAKDKLSVAKDQNNCSVREPNVRTLSRRAQKAKEKRNRQWEIRMRQELA